MAIDADTYTEVMAKYPSGVTVVTATDSEGRNFGLTLSAFCSVSLSPPLVLACVDVASNTLPAIQESRAFTVNILAAGAEQVAMRFASKDPDKFGSVDRSALRDGPSGPVLVSESVAFLQCRVVSEVLAGDHWVIIGEVESGEAFEADRPIVYCDRSFWAMSPTGD